MKIAPSKNPQKESEQFAIVAIACSAGSIFLWFLGIAGLAFGIRAAILSKRVKNNRYLVISLVAAGISLITVGYHFFTS